MLAAWKKTWSLLSCLFLLGQALLGIVLAQDKPVKEEGLVVTATKTWHSLEDVPVKTEVITRKEIENKKIKNLQEVLKGIPGLEVDMDSSSWGDKGKVKIRGLESKHVLILVDGHRVYGGHDASIDLQSYPTSMIERVEIVKGPGSALYGSEAMGGVINIITKDAKKGTNLTATAAAGSRDSQILESGLGWKGDSLGTLLNYTFKHSDGVDSDFDEYDEHALQASLDYQFSSGSSVSLKPYYSEQSMDYEDRRQKRFGLNPSWTWKPDDLSTMKLWGSWFNYDHESEDEETGETDTDYTHDIYELELNYTRLLFQRHLLTLGSQFECEERDDKSKGYDEDEEIISFFISDEIDLYPLVLVIGSRLDDHDKWGTEFTPKLSLAYHLSKDLKIRGSVGRGFNAPTLSKLYGGWRMGPYEVNPNPDLDPEKSWGYDLGADWEAIKGVSLSATLFQNDVDDLIVAEYSKKGPPPWDLDWRNIAEARTRGIELSASIDLVQNLTADLAYTYLDTEDLDTDKELPERPKHKFDMSLGYFWPKAGLSAFLEGQYLGHRYFDDENKERLGGYAVFDLVLNKDLGEHCQAFVRVDNLLGKKDIKDEYDLDGTECLAGIQFKL